MSMDVKNYAHQCQVCQRYKPEGAARSPDSDLLDQQISETKTRSYHGNVDRLVLVDYYTCWLELRSYSR